MRDLIKFYLKIQHRHEMCNSFHSIRLLIGFAFHFMASLLSTLGFRMMNLFLQLPLKILSDLVLPIPIFCSFLKLLFHFKFVKCLALLQLRSKYWSYLFTVAMLVGNCSALNDCFSIFLLLNDAFNYLNLIL